MTQSNQNAPIAIFDLDDTLIHTVKFYNDCRVRALAQLGTWGFDVSDAERILDEVIEPRNIALHGFAKHRFPLSLRDLYVELCNHKNQKPDPWNEHKLEAIGWSVYASAHPLTDGAENALHLLKEAGIKLVLLTKGDDEIQRFKLGEAGLAGYFDIVQVVPEKDVETYAKLCQEFELNPAQCYMIGDSIKSDINPALAAGMQALWVRCATPWIHEVATIDPRHTEVSNLAEATQFILERHHVQNQNEPAARL